ncbi:hypothetical protein Tco_1555757 [Tanacetum coccineum]
MYHPKCKTKGTTYVSIECRHFKKLGLGFLYAIEGYGHKVLGKHMEGTHMTWPDLEKKKGKKNEDPDRHPDAFHECA